MTTDVTELEVDYLKGGSILRTDRLSRDLLEAVHLASPFPPQDGRARPHFFRLMLSMPSRAGIDTIRFTASGAFGLRRDELVLAIPVTQYEQRTKLIFPFRGEGLVNVDGVLAGGHRNRSGQYAIDVLGLGKSYGPTIVGVPDESNESYAGWGREIIAPAAGTIVVARNDHLDQPVAGESNPKYFLPEHPNGGDPGNYVVIDHGNGEFSMLAHIQKGSVTVRAGDKVAQGQKLGLLGNSGDTSGPHLHYQLQNGPDWQNSDALPVRFENVGNIALGSFFNAK